jgi:tellurite resistance protein
MPKRQGVRTAQQRSRAEAAATATDDQEALMEAMIAACALIAHADGSVDYSERKRVFRLMRTIPSFSVFSTAEVAAEFERHEKLFEYDPFLGRDRALDAIEALAPRASDVKLLLNACQQVLDADGVPHPKEYEALKEVRNALVCD